MNRLNRILSLLLAVSAENAGLAQQPDDKFSNDRLYAGCQGAITGGQWLVHSFAWSQLPFKCTWAAETERFPAEFGELARKASAHFTAERDLTAQLQLSDLQLYRAKAFEPNPALKRQQLARGITDEELSRQWFLAVGFLGHQGGPIRRVAVMTLDGTLAVEEHRSRCPDNLTAMIGSSGTTSAAMEQARSAISKPEFTPPTVIWDAVRGSFPLDVGAEAAKARQHLVEKFKPSQPLRLVGVDVRTFYVNDAPPKHWKVAFEFRNENPEMYSVFMLLDGRIIGAAVMKADPERWQQHLKRMELLEQKIFKQEAETAEK